MNKQVEPLKINSLEEQFSEVIYAYTRQNMLDDGYLVDVTETAKRAGFTVPVALTRPVWEDCVEWDEDDTKRQTYQDIEGRLWDVIYMAFMGARICRDQSTFHYPMHRVPRGGRGKIPRKVVLKSVIGPGDQCELVITIVLPNED